MLKNVLKTEKREKVCKKMFIKNWLFVYFEMFWYIYIKDNLVEVAEKLKKKELLDKNCIDKNLMC